MINYFNENTLFSIDCSLNFRLSTVKKITTGLELNHLYYDDNILSVYKTPQQLVMLFSNYIIQERIASESLSKAIITDYLSNGAYVLGLFDSFEFPKSSHYKKNHNYNTFIIYGEVEGKFLTRCNMGITGSESVLLSESELKNIYCDDLAKTKKVEENEILGFPLSVLSKNENPFVSNKKASEWLYEFYSNINKIENFNIINYWIETKLNAVIRHNYPGKQYRNIANFKILRDMFSYHNIILTQDFPDIFENNNKAIKIIDIVISIYAKYIYTFDNRYIDRILFYFQELNKLVVENRRMIETL